MNQQLRRLCLGLGFALMAGGWGLTQYVEERQRTLDGNELAKQDLWIGQHSFWPEGNLYGKGQAKASRDFIQWAVMAMAAGAGLVGLALPAASPDPDEEPPKAA